MLMPQELLEQAMDILEASFKDVVKT